LTNDSIFFFVVAVEEEADASVEAQEEEDACQV
jgi:hypothetical protein